MNSILSKKSFPMIPRIFLYLWAKKCLMNSKRIINYFLQGLLFLVPISVTLWTIVALFNFIDGLLYDYIYSIIGVKIPGLGILVLLLIILLFGILGNTFLFNPVIRYFDRVMTRAPLITILYTAIKDLISAFVGQKKKFTEPVLVKIDKDIAMERIGFVTNRDISFLGNEKRKVAVYLPHAYAWSGNVVIVPEDHIQPIDLPATEVMKFIISAGVTNLNNKEL